MRIGWRNVMAKTQAELQALAAPTKTPKTASLSSAEVNPVYEQGGRKVTELGEPIKRAKDVAVGRGWSSFAQQQMVSTQWRLGLIAKAIRKGINPFASEQAILDIAEDLAQMENFVRGSERSVRMGQGSVLQRQPAFAGGGKAIVHLDKSLQNDLKLVLKQINKISLPASSITAELADDLAGKGQHVVGEGRIGSSLERMKVSIARLVNPGSQIFEDLNVEKRPVVKNWSPEKAFKKSASRTMKGGTSKLANPLLAGFSESTPELRAQSQARHALPGPLPRATQTAQGTTKYGTPFGEAMQRTMRNKFGGIAGTPLGNLNLPEGIIGEAGQKPPTRELTRTVQIPHPLSPGKTMGAKKVVGELPATLARPNLFESAPSQSIIKTQAEKTAMMGEHLEKKHIELGKKLKAMGINPKGTSAKLLPLMLSLGLLGMMGQE